MLQNYAWQFFCISRLLEDAYRELGAQNPPAFMPPPGLTGASLQPNASLGLAGFNLAPPPMPIPANVDLTVKQRGKIPSLLDLLDHTCIAAGYSGISNDIKRAITYIEGNYSQRDKAQWHLEHITDRIVDELSRHMFLYVPSDKTHYYLKNELFGRSIGDKFPKSSEDITNAGTCYALGLYTACVFHLMRVMEHCVQRFGKKLKAPINLHKESWHQIMLHVHKKIETLPSGAKASKAQNVRIQRFAVAAIRLDHVRLAWRNDVMHPKETYDQRQSLEVLTSVHTFLESIVSLI